MLREAESAEQTAQELEGIVGKLVECYAIPHTKMCMRWSKSTVEEYRREVVAWMEDYARSFPRLPKRALASGETLPAYARRLLDADIARILDGKHAAVERSYRDLFG